jgi:hypothetical protein
MNKKRTNVESPDDREKEALKWAIEYFRKSADEMTPEGSRRWALHDMLVGLLFLYDSQLPSNRAAAEEDIKHYVEYAWLGNQEASQHMRELAAVLMERGDPLPDGLHHFIVEFLRNPNKPRWPSNVDEKYLSFVDEVRSLIARKPGQGSSDLAPRNVTIWAAVEHIVRTWKFPATRNRATTRRASATSIVREAIEKGARLHLIEAAVVKAWRKMRPGGEDAVVRDPGLLHSLINGPSEKIATD